MVATSFPSSAPNSYASATLKRELQAQLKVAESQHEINYSLLISSVLIAVAMTALLWLVSNSLNLNDTEMTSPANYGYQRLPVQTANPTADIAQSTSVPATSGSPNTLTN